VAFGQQDGNLGGLGGLSQGESVGFYRKPCFVPTAKQSRQERERVSRAPPVAAEPNACAAAALRLGRSLALPRGTDEHQLGDGVERKHPSAYANGLPVGGHEGGGRHELKPCHYPQIQLFVPWAFGNRPFRPESQTRAEQNETLAPMERLVLWVTTRAEAHATTNGHQFGDDAEVSVC